MTWFVESPWPALALGGAAEAALAVWYVRSGRAAAWVGMAIAAAAVCGMVIFERVVVTESEQIEDTLHAVAEALLADDTKGVLTYFSANSPKRAEVQNILSHVRVKSARIGTDLEIHIDHLASPPTATTRFTGYVEGRDLRGEIPYEHFIRRFTVTLRREGDHWLIADYSQAEPRGGAGRK